MHICIYLYLYMYLKLIEGSPGLLVPRNNAVPIRLMDCKPSKGHRVLEVMAVATSLLPSSSNRWITLR